MAATIPELKRLLIQARFEKALAMIPAGNCPNCYFKVTYLTGCMSSDPNDTCIACKYRFKQALYKQIEEEVMAL
jgi:hypothetical protein